MRKNIYVTKYQEYVKRMLETNKAVFDAFRKLHDDYAMKQDELQEKFNAEGEKVLLIIQEWEGKLCSQSEKAGYANYTGGLAEKFRDEVKKVFPMIDWIGVKSTREPSFFLKRIKL